MKKLVLAFALSLAATASPAMAEGPSMRTVAVQTADLNLQSEQGRAVLDNRLNSAIDKVCAVHRTPGLPAWIRFRKCVEAKKQEVQPLRDAAIARARVGAQVAVR
ncbi:MAG: UrcA family protein [Erythrobacter sp.]|nr:UrcA family protein [Erythrobacter sp.]